ncbi:hypothetical protein [Vibrio sp. Isolate22]|nr:hypothetical protein [Vibrio sp. Isolate22]
MNSFLVLENDVMRAGDALFTPLSCTELFWLQCKVRYEVASSSKE